MYLVAYGVGSGDLKLPIHDDCPRPLAILLQGITHIIIISLLICVV